MRVFALVLLLPLLSGCYLLTQGYGQLRILLDSRGIDELLADPSVPDKTKFKLLFVREVKSFGEHELGLVRSANYESFYDTQGRPITYIVSACAKDRFQPHLWWFPIVGDVPYKGFFAKADAEAEAASLEKQIQALEKSKADALQRFQANARQIIYADILWGLFNSTEFTFNH